MGGVISSPIKAVLGSVSQSKPAPAPQPVTPTQAEVSQSAATDAEGLTKMQKARRRGRSATILTSTAGVEGETTLGTKSLLGG